MRLRRKREAPPPDPAALVAQACHERLAAMERLRVARADIVAARSRADSEKHLESLARSDAVLEAAVTLVQQQLDTLRQQRARIGSAAMTASALAGVQADLDALALEFAPVLQTLTGDEPAGSPG